MFNWFAFLTYAVITAATPGPNNIMSMSNGGRLGFKGALPFNFCCGNAYLHRFLQHPYRTYTCG